MQQFVEEDFLEPDNNLDHELVDKIMQEDGQIILEERDDPEDKARLIEEE